MAFENIKAILAEREAIAKKIEECEERAKSYASPSDRDATHPVQMSVESPLVSDKKVYSKPLTVNITRSESDWERANKERLATEQLIYQVLREHLNKGSNGDGNG